MSDVQGGPGAGLPPDWQPGYSTCDDVSAICPVEATVYGDYFTLGACVFFVIAHFLLFGVQVFLGWRSRAWSFAVWLGIGTLFEVMGYSARIALSKNPWNYEGFVIQLLMLMLGPTLVAAAISITFKHLVLWYGPKFSFLRPRLYPWVFVGSDWISIVIQAAGGGVSATATSGGETTDPKLFDVGSGLLVAGVIFQLVNMVVCGCLMLAYLWRRRQAIKSGAAPASDTRPEDKKVKKFIYAITVAYVAIIIRCIYRIPEMQLGWGSTLMQNETTFLILDGAMILIAVATLTAFHPHFYFPFLGRKDGKSIKTEAVEAGGVTAGSTTTTDVEESGARETKPAQ